MNDRQRLIAELLDDNEISTQLQLQRLLARRGVPAVAIAWDAWRETGMAVATEVPEELRAWRRESLEQGLASREGGELFDRIAGSGLPQVLVSTLPFDLRLEQSDRLGSLGDLQALGGPQGMEGAAAPREAHPRPELANPYVAPRTEVEGQIAAVWRAVRVLDEHVAQMLLELLSHRCSSTQSTARPSRSSCNAREAVARTPLSLIPRRSAIAASVRSL